MAENGEPMISTADEILAKLRSDPENAIQTSFPSAGVDLYVFYYPECGHYGVRVTDFGTDPTDPENIRIQEAELSEHDVLMRMYALLEADVSRDPMGRDARIALEMSMVDEG
jgi:hypothetical protein